MGGAASLMSLRVASDADDLVGIALVLEPDVTPERIAAREVLPRERLIDDDTARLIHVGVAKVASGQEWRAVREEIVGRHNSAIPAASCTGRRILRPAGSGSLRRGHRRRPARRNRTARNRLRRGTMSR
jgi:hypothetical protein